MTETSGSSHGEGTGRKEENEAEIPAPAEWTELDAAAQTPLQSKWVFWFHKRGGQKTAAVNYEVCSLC